MASKTIHLVRKMSDFPQQSKLIYSWKSVWLGRSPLGESCEPPVQWSLIKAGDSEFYLNNS